MREELALRRRIAECLAKAWGETGTVRVILLAGSTGTGYADAYSDVELDVFWSEPPTQEQRRHHATLFGAQVLELHPLEEQEWSDVLKLDELRIDVSHVLQRTVEQYVHEVSERGETDVEKQILLSHLLEGTVLFDKDSKVDHWRKCIVHFPQCLLLRVLAENLQPHALWSQRKTLIAREDLVCLQILKTESLRRLLAVLSAMNGIYRAHPAFKWSRELIARMAYSPPELSYRIESILRLEAPAAVAELESLAEDCCNLVEARIPEFDTTAARGAWSATRPQVGVSALEATLLRIEGV